MVYATLVSNGAITSSFVPLNTPKDFEALVNYKNKNVAIYSQGDTQTDCYAAINKFGALNVDVLVLAYSTKKTQLIVDPALYNEFRVQKTVASSPGLEVQVNAIDCQTIISQI
jgi:hypothetical protein